MTGKIIRLVRDRGFGFIKSDEPLKNDVFFHMSDLVPPFTKIKEEDKVVFDLLETSKGLRAEGVRIL